MMGQNLDSLCVDAGTLVLASNLSKGNLKTLKTYLDKQMMIQKRNWIPATSLASRLLFN